MASWIVLDWVQDQFHVLCAQSTRRGVQVTRAITWAHPEPFTPSTAERVGKALRDFLKAAKIAPAPVIVGIGRDRIFLKELRFPPIAPHEEASLVRFQTGKEMAEPVENYAIDYANLSNGSGDRQIMTVAVRRDIVSLLQNLCQAAGLKLHAVTPRLFGLADALVRALEPNPSPLKPNQLTAVLNVGQRWAELCFFRGERLLQAQALANGPLLAGEVKRNLAVFQAQHAASLDLIEPDCLYAFCSDPAIAESLQGGQHLPLRLLDPLHHEPEAVAEGASPGQFAGAVGLASVWSRPSERPVNLSVPKRQSAPVSMTRQRVAVYSGAAALLLVFFVGFMAYILYDKRKQIEQLTVEKEEHKTRFNNYAQERADLDAYKEWEQTTIPWLDELYDLTARYPHAVGFRVNQLSAGPTELKRTAKENFVGKITLNGLTPKVKGTDYVHGLQNSMARDSHVRPSNGGILKDGGFSIRIDVARQDALKYETQLIVPPRPVAQSSPTELKTDDEKMKKDDTDTPEGDDK